ncbi:MAG TPA: 16S rRNA (adenine(1518)-N(6)/adenine(1519)-N(6))-dimethyltransferase RsmA [Syntrophobacteraceae bacterium]|nr:16S rRNA (adenine(1518)-N(6)/adenine(1519)-N(6))-dimethyltransferase RsmA [Syntrophobacteraceae bacterium]
MLISPNQYYRMTGIKSQKPLGQHFLTQPCTALRIVESAQIRDSDVVVEVGPGLGALTQFLLPKGCALHLVELDGNLASFLREAVSRRSPAVQIHEMNVLDFDFRTLARSVGQSLVVVGNLPYNISSPLIFSLLEAHPAFSRAVFMVQKEVGLRLAADPGTGEYGVLSVLLGMYAQTKILFGVGPGQFFPRPKVDSLVVRMDFSGEGLAGELPFSFLRILVSTAFQQRRKTLRNSLKDFSLRRGAKVEEVLSLAQIDPGRRPETLSPLDFVRLGAVLKGSRNPVVAG